MRKRTILLILLLLAVVVGGLIYRSSQAPPASAAGRTADLSVAATDLFAEFRKDEMEAGKRYNDKLVEVSGIVRSVSTGRNGKEVLLETGDPMGAVVCDFAVNEKPGLSAGDAASIQGYCAGYNMDVLLQRCSIAH